MGADITTNAQTAVSPRRYRQPCSSTLIVGTVRIKIEKMKGIALLIALLFFLSYYGLSQTCTVIKHVGDEDREMPVLLIKTGEINRTLIDSLVGFDDSDCCKSIITIDLLQYNIVENLILKSNYLEPLAPLNTFRYCEYGITIAKINTKNNLCLSLEKSGPFFIDLIEKSKREKLDINLIKELEYVLSYIKHM